MSKPYNQWPYRITVTSLNYWDAILWCRRNLMEGSWTSDYTKPNTIKFTHKEDSVTFAIIFG